MKTLRTLLLTVTACASVLLSQSQVIKFRKVLGNDGYEQGNCVIQTFDGGYVVAGSTSSAGSGSTDMQILKTDMYGVPESQKLIGGINVDQGVCIRQLADSGFVLLGHSNSYSVGGYDIILTRLDKLFNVTWSRAYGGDDWDFGSCVEPTSDGGYIICGSTYSYGAGEQDYYLIKTDALGDTVWTRTYGGAKDDIARSVVPTSDGGYVLTGTTKSKGDTLGDIYTIKTLANGDTVWTNKFGGPLLPDEGYDILEMQSVAAYILCGETQAYSPGNSDGIVFQMSSSGFVFGVPYLTYAAGYDAIRSVTEDTLGRIGFTGVINFGSSPDVFFGGLRSDWTPFATATTFGGLNTDIGNSIAYTDDNAFIMCGTTSSFNNFLDDIYLIKTDSVCNSATWGSMSDSYFTTSVDASHDTEQEAFFLYPNPSTGICRISASLSNENFTLSLSDILGREIKKMEISGATQEVDLSALADGIYVVRFTTRDTSGSQKLVIRR